MKILFALLQGICFIAFTTSSSSNIEPKGNAKIQDSAADCALSMALKYFEEGSIIAIVKSGLHTVTNFNLTRNTYNLISDKIMEEMRWSIMIKKSISHGEYEVLTNKREF